MQWYEATSKKLEVGHRYSHQELIKLLKNDYPQMRDSSYHWAVCGMLKSGNLTKVARNVYVMQNEREKPVYRPAYSDLAAKLIGKINGRYGDMGKHMMLIVPGRVGTTSPELGVPTAFFDISAYEIICEIEESKAGYNPELSYGSHIFQDLVESEILYTAVFNNEKTIHFSPEKLESSKDIFSEFEQSQALSDIVHIYDVSDRKCTVYNDVTNEHLMITC